MRRPPTRAVTVLVALALAGALLALAAPVWVSATLSDPLTGRPVPVSGTGTGAAPLVGALALVGAAAAVAVSTARGALLRVCAVVLALTGLGALAAVVAVVLDPAAPLTAAAQQVSGTTTAPLADVARSPWAFLAGVPAAGLLACGLWALVAGPRWSSSARFERAPAGRAQAGTASSGTAPSGAATPVTSGRSDEQPGTAAPALWDSLSRGADPTGADEAPDPPHRAPDGPGARAGA